MRSIYKISVIFFLSSIALAEGKQSLNAARGFEIGKCYQEMASIDCKSNADCILLVFPHLQGQLSFRVVSAPKGMKKSLYYRVQFQINKKQDSMAEILTAEPMDPFIADSELRKVDYMGHAISCKNLVK